MKGVFILLFAALAIFIIQPFQSACGQPQKVACCSKKEENKTAKDAGCNPFVNCCYRTFEVVAIVRLQSPETVFQKPLLHFFKPTPLAGFLTVLWQPPDGDEVK